MTASPAEHRPRTLGALSSDRTRTFLLGSRPDIGSSSMHRTMIAVATLALLGLVITPTAAAVHEPDCAAVYDEHQVGPVGIIQCSACDDEVAIDEDWQPSDERP